MLDGNGDVDELSECFNQDWSYTIDEIKSELETLGYQGVKPEELKRMKIELDKLINTRKGQLILDTCMGKVEEHVNIIDADRKRFHDGSQSNFEEDLLKMTTNLKPAPEKSRFNKTTLNAEQLDNFHVDDREGKSKFRTKYSQIPDQSRASTTSLDEEDSTYEMPDMTMVNRPSTAPSQNPGKVKVSIPMLKTFLRPGSRLNIHDPIRMHQQYLTGWKKFPTPEEKRHQGLRNSVHKKMQQVEIPMNSEIFEKIIQSKSGQSITQYGKYKREPATTNYESHSRCSQDDIVNIDLNEYLEDDGTE